MRKNLIITGCIFLLALLFFPGCQKQAKENTFSENASEEHSRDHHGTKKEECRLSHLDWGDGSSWDLNYNRKGLADRWVFNNGDGTQNIFTMKYDHYDRLVRGTAEIPEGKFRIEFKYKGRLLVKEQWYNVADNSLFADKINHYDRKERIKMQEDIVSDSKVFYTYDINGNPLTVDLYFAGVIVFSSRFSYEISNRHPYLAINGLPYTFPYYDAPSIGKRWESGAKYIFYDENGAAIVYSNADAANTVMQKGSRHYLSKLTAYDEVSQSNYVYTFSYQNCISNWKEDNHTYAPQSMKAKGIRSGKINFLVGDRQNVKRKLLEIRQELLNQ